MSGNNYTFIPKTVRIPLSESEEYAFEKMLDAKGYKKGGFLKSIIITELRKEGFLPEDREVSTLPGTNK